MKNELLLTELKVLSEIEAKGVCIVSQAPVSTILNRRDLIDFL